MPSAVSLHDLIGALTGAVTQAQDTIHKHQLAMIGDYFDLQGRPLSFALMLPAVSQAAEVDESRQVAVPLLSIVEPNLLSISEFEVEFDVELGSMLDAASAGTEPGAPARPMPASGPSAIDTSEAAAAPTTAASPLQRRKPCAHRRRRCPNSFAALSLRSSPSSPMMRRANRF